MPITDEQIAKHKAASPGVEMHVISNMELGIEVLVKQPTDKEWTVFRGMQNDDAQKPFALRQLVIGCILEPSPAEFVGMLATRPGLSETFGADLVQLAGVSRANTRRKV